MARLAYTGEGRRMAWAGLLGYSVPVFVAMFLLLIIEGELAEFFEGVGRSGVPRHVVFRLLFVPTAFLITAAGAGALGIALRDRSLAGRMALYAGIAAALAFLVVNLTMDALGWRVGAPRTEERFTMLTVLMVSNVSAALVGGSVVGELLARYAPAEGQASAPAMQDAEV